MLKKYYVNGSLLKKSGFMDDDDVFFDYSSRKNFSL